MHTAQWIFSIIAGFFVLYNHFLKYGEIRDRLLKNMHSDLFNSIRIYEDTLLTNSMADSIRERLISSIEKEGTNRFLVSISEKYMTFITIAIFACLFVKSIPAKLFAKEIVQDSMMVRFLVSRDMDIIVTALIFLLLIVSFVITAKLSKVAGALERFSSV